MSEFVNITVDGVAVQAPKGLTVVDAAKRGGVDIPVFCHHPKLEPVGMCRMCLVRIGLPMSDRATREPILNEDGSPKYNWGHGLQTGCTVYVREGMAIKTNTEEVDEAREHVIEFLLTSHPLDCPICDKGGECPLQNLTMRHGDGNSRFDFSEKMKLMKHVPLGDLIHLDRERCIQCGRCTRFQDEIVADPVIAFHNRGRKLEIVTNSEPGFDSIWSGNTTDICPVGALTTADFRFGARPWELNPAASICPHCPVGCNTTMSTRREAKSGGRPVIKRIMPRQNEQVNEIWICDKGRFVHHFADAPGRIKAPLMRKNGELVEVSWEEALQSVADRLQMHAQGAAGVAGDRLSNEDLFLFQKLFRKGLNNNNVSLANPRMAGGDVVAQVGIASGSNLGELGKGDAIVVFASDLHEEAPIWWLRVKQAAERGATLVVMGNRSTRLDAFASQVVHYPAGTALSAAQELLAENNPLLDATNLVIFYGSEGLTYDETEALAKTFANVLLAKGHAGQKNSGLIPVWPHNNTQGAWDMGIRPGALPGYKAASETGLTARQVYDSLVTGEIRALYVLGADPIGDGLMTKRDKLALLVVQDLFMTETAKQADIVLPAQSWAEREGTYTNGERRVQRFFPAIPAVGHSRPDWQILAQIGEQMDIGKAPYAASLVFKELSRAVRVYKKMTYRTLAKVEKQFPDVGGEDLYYGGNAYNNEAGLGEQWAVVAESKSVMAYDLPQVTDGKVDGLQVISAVALYRPGTLTDLSNVLQTRLAQPTIFLHEQDAQELDVTDGEMVTARVKGDSIEVMAHVNGATQPGLAVIKGGMSRPGRAKLWISK